MPGKFTHALVALTILILSASSARADDATGTICVSVPASAGSFLIDISSDLEPSRHWTATVEAARPATMAGLPPAAYRVVATASNGKTATLALTIAPSEIVQIASGPGVNPTADPTLVIIDRHRARYSTVFSSADLERLPTGGTAQSIVETASPFVVGESIDSGGLQAARSNLFGSRGASGRETSTRLGEIDLLRRPVSGAPALVPEIAWLEGVVVGSGLARPDVPFPGATVTLVPRRPGNRTGALDVSFTGRRMVSSNAIPTAPSVEALTSLANVDVQAGLPIDRRASLFASATVTRARKFDGHLGVESPVNTASLFVHLLSNLTARDVVRLLGVTQSLQRELDGRLQFLDRSATERSRVSHGQIVWEHQFAGGARAETDLGLQRGSFVPAIPSVTGAIVDRIADGAVPPPAAKTIATRIDLRMIFEPRERRLAGFSHAWQFGLLVTRSGSTAHVVAAPTVAETVGGLPARVWMRGFPAADSNRRVTTNIVFASDRVPISDRLTFDVAVGVGASSGSARGAASAAAWTLALPRASFRWTPPVGSVFGGYSLYEPAISLDQLAFGDPGEAAVSVYRWNDLNADGRLDFGETGLLVARSGRSPDVASIDAAVHAPRTHEWTLGIERQITRQSSFRAITTIRKERGVLRSVNVGVPASAYLARQLPDQGEDYLSTRDDRPLTVYDRLPISFGQDRLVLMNTGQRGYYEGIELTYSLATSRWTSTFGTMAYRSKGFGGNRGYRSTENDQGVLGEFLENPNAASYADGRLFFDRAYVAKWATTFQAPRDISVAVIARYQDGQPFSRFVVATGLAQGPEAVSAYRAGRTRFTFTSTVDLRVRKDVRVLGHRAGVWLDMFNLANDANEVEENPLTGLAFRQSTLLQPPRTVRLGFRVAF